MIISAPHTLGCAWRPEIGNENIAQTTAFHKKTTYPKKKLEKYIEIQLRSSCRLRTVCFAKKHEPRQQQGDQKGI
jgi:hypothetical protein